jgi:NitT/TauT family transport system substrate-binding protein
VEYVNTDKISKTLSAGDFDVTGLESAVTGVANLDRGGQITMLSGAHGGCFDAVGNDQVHSLRDLKGKTVAVSAVGGSDHAYLSSMIAYVGLNPNKDINWVALAPDEATQRLSEGKVDALMAFTPRSMELRANKVGHEIFNTRLDKPWSQYFSCMMAGNREFVRKNPVATKRWLRATLRASDIANQQPERAARFMVDAGHNSNYDHVLQAMKELPSGAWREYDPEDTLRFYALRLNEVGMIKSSPNDIIARGTDWRFLNELKKELKG